MKALKWVLMALAVAILLVQMVRPAKNVSGAPSTTNISLHFPVPQAVQTVLQRSCNDCHSNNTVYPWYAEIEPVGWWLNKHILDGKRGLNFDEFTSYRLMKQYRRFNDIIEQVQKDEMPLPSYLIVHRNARLSTDEKNELVQWCTAMRDSMKAKFPVDSLERKPRK
jgi:hypothetical protein